MEVIRMVGMVVIIARDETSMTCGSGLVEGSSGTPKSFNNRTSSNHPSVQLILAEQHVLQDRVDGVCLSGPRLAVNEDGLAEALPAQTGHRHGNKGHHVRRDTRQRPPFTHHLLDHGFRFVWVHRRRGGCP